MKAEGSDQLRENEKELGVFGVQGMKAKNPKRKGSGQGRRKWGYGVQEKKNSNRGGGCAFFLAEMKSAAAWVREKKGL